MDPRVKEFIEANIDLIDTEDFVKLYQLADHILFFSTKISEMTTCLLRSKINPLEVLDEVPPEYLYNSAYLDSLNLPDSIWRIGESAFHGNTNLTTVVCGENLDTIGYGAFMQCSKLETVILNNKLERISNMAFRDTALKELRLPDSIKRIEGIPFDNTTKLLVLPGTVAHEWAVKNNYPVELLY